MIYKLVCRRRKRLWRIGNRFSVAIVLEMYVLVLIHVDFFHRLKKKKEQNMKAKQMAEETGNIGGIEISEREEREAENNIEKLQAVSRFN